VRDVKLHVRAEQLLHKESANPRERPVRARSIEHLDTLGAISQWKLKNLIRLTDIIADHLCRGFAWRSRDPSHIDSVMDVAVSGIELISWTTAALPVTSFWTTTMDRVDQSFILFSTFHVSAPLPHDS